MKTEVQAEHTFNSAGWVISSKTSGNVPHCLLLDPLAHELMLAWVNHQLAGFQEKNVALEKENCNLRSKNARLETQLNVVYERLQGLSNDSNDAVVQTDSFNPMDPMDTVVQDGHMYVYNLVPAKMYLYNLLTASIFDQTSEWTSEQAAAKPALQWNSEPPRRREWGIRPTRSAHKLHNLKKKQVKKHE